MSHGQRHDFWAPQGASAGGGAGAARASAPQQPPRLAAGHEMIGSRLQRFRRSGKDSESKERATGRVRGVRDSPGRGPLFAVVWDDRPQATEELTRDELDVYLCSQQQPPAAPARPAVPAVPAHAPPRPPSHPPPPPQPPAQLWGSPVTLAGAGNGAQPRPPAPKPAPAMAGHAAAPATAPAPPDSPEGKFVGVRLEKSGKWKAEIRLPLPPDEAAGDAAAGAAPKRGKMKSLGLYDTAEDAAAAYDAAAREAGKTAVNMPLNPGETRVVKPRKRERAPKPPQPAPAPAPGGFPALDAQRRALAAASNQASAQAARPAQAPPEPPAKRPRASPDAAAPADTAIEPSKTFPASGGRLAEPLAANRKSAPVADELGAALARHGLGGLAPRFAAERLDAALLRAAGPGLLRGREAQERLGVTTLGDAMRLGLVLKTLGIGWDP